MSSGPFLLLSSSEPKRLHYALPWFAVSYRLSTYRKVRGSHKGLETSLTLVLRDGRRIVYVLSAGDLRNLAKAAREQLRQRQ